MVKLRLTLIFALLSGAVLAQSRPNRRAPDLANVSYGPHERNVLDLWKASSGRPTPLVIHIHGGGFTQGDKSGVSPILLDLCLENGISVASINYRYSTIAPYPAPMRDGARAVQFLRLHAREYNLDPKAFAATGGSAGAGISLWTGFHDDLADPKSDDPVLRESSRLACMGVTNGQTTYDPRAIAKLIDENTSRIQALRLLFGLRDGESPTEATFRLYDDGSPITHLTADDPPAFLYYSTPNNPLPPPNVNIGIHHPRFGYFLKERMDKLGIACEVHLASEYRDNAPRKFHEQMVKFFRDHFPSAR